MSDYFDDDPGGDDFFGRCEDDDLQSELARPASRSEVLDEFDVFRAASDAAMNSAGVPCLMPLGESPEANGCGSRDAAVRVFGRGGRVDRRQSSSRVEPPLPPPGHPPAGLPGVGRRKMS